MGIGAPNFGGNDFGNYHVASVSGRKFEESGRDTSDPPRKSVANQPHRQPGNGIPVGPLTVNTLMHRDITCSQTLRLAHTTLTEGSKPGWQQSWPWGCARRVRLQCELGREQSGGGIGNYMYATVSGRELRRPERRRMRECRHRPGPLVSGQSSGRNDSFGNQVHRIKMTDMSGDYLFDSVVPGNYTVSEEQQLGWTANEGQSGYPIAPVSGEGIRAGA